MAFRYRHLRRIATPGFFSGLQCQECGQSTNIFESSLFSFPCALGKFDAASGRTNLYFSRFSTASKISKEVFHEVDLCSFLRSSFDQAEGPCHRWLNRPENSKRFPKGNRVILLLAQAFLEDSLASWEDRIAMLEKVKLLQQRYQWLHIFGFQSSSSIGSKTDLNHLLHVIKDEYINFPILWCDKTFPEVANGACCFLFKDVKDPPLYYGRDVDLGALQKDIRDLKQQLDKKVTNADKLKSPWGKQPEGFREPFVCSSLRNMLLYNPVCISADEDGHRLFLSDNNHHRLIVFDSSGTILDVIGSSPGFEDGDFETARLMRPAASYYHASEDCLYFVDSENHAIRRADMGTRLVETLYPAQNDNVRSGLWTWIFDKLGLRRNMGNDLVSLEETVGGVKPVESDSKSLFFPWHLLRSESNDLVVMNRSFDTLWIINLDRGVICDFVRGQRNIMELYGQKIMEKVSCLKDMSSDFLQNLVYSNSLEGIPYSGLMSSFVTLGDSLIICDRVGQRVLMLNKQTKMSSTIKLSNLGILGLPYWLPCSLERVFPTGDVSEEPVDHVQSFKFFPGRIDMHLAIDIPTNTELHEPLHESCVWRQTRGAAMEVLGLENIASATEKVGVAQQWYDELDNLAFETETEPEVSTEESTARRKMEDGKIHINCVVNTSPGTSEVAIFAPLYLKLRSDSENCKETQETKAAQIAGILKADREGRLGKDAFINFLAGLDRDLGDLVFIKPLRVKIKFDILNHPKTVNSRDTTTTLTDSSIDVNVVLN